MVEMGSEPFFCASGLTGHDHHQRLPNEIGPQKAFSRASALIPWRFSGAGPRIAPHICHL